MRFLLISILVFLVSWGEATAGAQDDDGEVGEELELLKEADFPDLVAKDETGEIMDEFAFLKEEDLVYSAAKHIQPVVLSPSAVVVITRKDIEASGATTFADLLRRYVVVAAYSADPFFDQYRVREVDRLMIAVDGREINNELFNTPLTFFLPVSIHDIERVEIVLGPNSALYGANAVAAVINIITRRHNKHPYADLVVAAGEHGTTLAGGRLEGKLGPLVLQGSFWLDRAHSWMAPDQRARNHKIFNSSARLDLGKAQLTATGSLVSSGGSMFSSMGTIHFEEILGAFAGLELKYGGLKSLAYWNGGRTRFDIDMGLVEPSGGILLGRLPTTDATLDTIHLESQYDLEPFEGNLLIAGGDFRYTRLRCPQLVETDIKEYRVGVFLHAEQVFLDRFMLTGGIRFDWNSVSPWALSPQLALVYKLGGQHYLRLAGGRAFRKPTIMETKGNFKINSDFPEIRQLFERFGIGAAEVANEHIISVDLGYNGNILDGFIKIMANLSYNRFDNWIGFKTEVVFNQFNQIDLDRSIVGYRSGLNDQHVVVGDLFVELNPHDRLSLFFNGMYRFNKKDDREYRDAYHIVVESAHIRASGGFTLRLPWGLTAHLVLVYVKAGYMDDLRNPYSILAPNMKQYRASPRYFMGALTYRVELGDHLLDLGLSFFNPFGPEFNDKNFSHTMPDGSNFGSERMGSRTLLTARFQY